MEDNQHWLSWPFLQNLLNGIDKRVSQKQGHFFVFMLIIYQWQWCRMNYSWNQWHQAKLTSYFSWPDSAKAYQNLPETLKIWICMSGRVFVFVCGCVYMGVRVCICLRSCVYIRVFVFVCVFMCVYSNTASHRIKSIRSAQNSSQASTWNIKAEQQRSCPHFAKPNFFGFTLNNPVTNPPISRKSTRKAQLCTAPKADILKTAENRAN